MSYQVDRACAALSLSSGNPQKQPGRLSPILPSTPRSSPGSLDECEQMQQTPLDCTLPLQLGRRIAWSGDGESQEIGHGSLKKQLWKCAVAAPQADDWLETLSIDSSSVPSSPFSSSELKLIPTYTAVPSVLVPKLATLEALSNSGATSPSKETEALFDHTSAASCSYSATFDSSCSEDDFNSSSTSSSSDFDVSSEEATGGSFDTASLGSGSPRERDGTAEERDLLLDLRSAASDTYSDEEFETMSVSSHGSPRECDGTAEEQQPFLDSLSAASGSLFELRKVPCRSRESSCEGSPRAGSPAGSEIEELLDCNCSAGTCNSPRVDDREPFLDSCSVASSIEEMLDSLSAVSGEDECTPLLLKPLVGPDACADTTPVATVLQVTIPAGPSYRTLIGGPAAEPLLPQAARTSAPSSSTCATADSGHLSEAWSIFSTRAAMGRSLFASPGSSPREHHGTPEQKEPLLLVRPLPERPLVDCAALGPAYSTAPPLWLRTGEAVRAQDKVEAVLRLAKERWDSSAVRERLRDPDFDASLLAVWSPTKVLESKAAHLGEIVHAAGLPSDVAALKAAFANESLERHQQQEQEKQQLSQFNPRKGLHIAERLKRRHRGLEFDLFHVNWCQSLISAKDDLQSAASLAARAHIPALPPTPRPPLEPAPPEDRKSVV